VGVDITDSPESTLEGVRSIVATTLGITDRADTFTAESGLLGSLPELDSQAVVEIVTALEEHFDLEVDESDLSAEVFETFGSLARFVDATRDQ
jgi:acyl carrier protein